MTKRPARRNVGDIQSERDVVMGNQYNVTADLQPLAEQLDALIALLREPHSTVQVEQSGQGNIVVEGNHNSVTVAATEWSRFALLQRQADPIRREQIYLTRFILDHTYARWEHHYLKLAGQLVGAPLRLTDRADQNMSGAGEPLDDIREALTKRDKPHLVILGDPGAGKTTTLERLALDLARERLRDPLNAKLPVRVDLFLFTAPDPQPDDFLRAHWETTGLAITYGEAVANGEVCFLLDGLNQMPTNDRNKRLENWSHWARFRLHNNWAVFTCRIADYVPNLRLPEVRVQTLDEGRMRQYFDLRFAPEEAARQWTIFEQRLRSGDHRFQRLARNPFMLSRLVERAAQGKTLTDSRALLMQDLALDLLDRELQYGRQPDVLTADPQGTLTAALEALSRLAFAMQVEGEGTSLTYALAAGVSLTDGPTAPLTLDEVLKLTTDATVLERAEGQGKEAIYAFYHHLLQEYFAARELLRQFRAGADLAQRWRVPWSVTEFAAKELEPGEALAPPPTTGWEEAVIMAAGLAGKQAAQFIEAVQKDNLPLAGRCVAETGPDQPGLTPLANHLRTELLTRQRATTTAHLRARIDAGLALGELGHPELRPEKFDFDSRVIWAIVPPLQDVPEGEFVRGSDPTDKRAYRQENTSERKITLPAFRMGRYPVTNAEFRLFIDTNGYTTDRWWGEAGLKWKQGGPNAHDAAIEDWMTYRKIVADFGVEKAGEQLNWRPSNVRYWKEVTQLSEDDARQRARRQFSRPFDRPAFWDDPTLNRPARPVVGVNWHEVEAYCNWLSAITGQSFRLPFEMEWEKAARGDDGPEYPWGEEFDSALCNTIESHIYTTTPIGLYPDGQSPYKLFDVSGNVWEWTADWYTMYPRGEPSDDFGEKFRVVRGGAWSSDHRYARCAYRGRYVPALFNDYIGFRVSSPGSYS